MTLFAVESFKAATDTAIIVAHTSSRAISSSFAAVAVEWIRSGGTLLQFACRSAIAVVTEAAHRLGCVPRFIIDAASLVSQHALREADAAVVAVFRANCALAGNAIVAVKAFTHTSGAITDALVGALSPRV